MAHLAVKVEDESHPVRRLRDAQIRVAIVELTTLDRDAEVQVSVQVVRHAAQVLFRYAALFQDLLQAAKRRVAQALDFRFR